MVTRTTPRGFALPVVILVLFILTSAIATGVMLMRTERRLNDNGDELLRARLLAESGLQRAVGDRAALGLAAVPTANDSVRVTVSDGYYDVTSTILRPAASPVPALILLRSHAVISRAKVAGQPAANFTVSLVARGPSAGSVTWSIQGAWTAANGVNIDGNAGSVSGTDSCAKSAGGTGSVAAISVPVRALDKNGFEGNANKLSGSQKLDTLALTSSAAADSIPINWSSLSKGTGITPDFTVSASGSGFPAASYFTSNPTKWPLIFINNSGGTFNFPNYLVRGLVIVVGNATLTGNSLFQGLIVTGGYVNTDGSSSIQGSLITGLDYKLGKTPQPNELRGNKTTQYNSCYVKNALTQKIF